MARGTDPRCAREHCVHVAAFAGLQPVRAGQFEAGRQVVEFAPGHLGGSGAACQAAAGAAVRGGSIAGSSSPPAHCSRAALNVVVTWQRWHCRPNWPRCTSSSAWQAAQSCDGFDHVRGLLVAALAGHLRVGAGQCELRRLAVIELPQVPAVWGMARLAVTTERSLVAVVRRMAIDARLRRTLERGRAVAREARHGDVQSDQRECRKVVVELQVAAPGLHAMALRAVGAEPAGMHVVGPVASGTFGAELLAGDDARCGRRGSRASGAPRAARICRRACDRNSSAVHALAAWHFSQAAPKRVAWGSSLRWQPAQSLGNGSLMLAVLWHALQSSEACAPVSANPVARRWSYLVPVQPVVWWHSAQAAPRAPAWTSSGAWQAAHWVGVSVYRLPKWQAAQVACRACRSARTWSSRDQTGRVPSRRLRGTGAIAAELAGVRILLPVAIDAARTAPHGTCGPPCGTPRTPPTRGRPAAESRCERAGMTPSRASRCRHCGPCARCGTRCIGRSPPPAAGHGIPCAARCRQRSAHGRCGRAPPGATDRRDRGSACIPARTSRDLR